MHRVAVFLLFAAAAIGQPFVYYRGVVNSASFLPPGLPNGSIARGSMFSIFGRNLGPASAQQVSAFPLQATFAGVSVELSQGSTKVNALPVYVSATQLNVILPSSTPVGAVSLRVLYNGQTGNPIPITVAPTSIGLFSVNGGGFGPGIVQNFVSQASQPINSLSATARPGQTEILWGTGIGPATFSDAVAPTAVTLDSSLELFVGGKKATIAYAGRTPCCASIDQIVFTVPADAPSGCYVPVVVRTRVVVVSNTVTMAIHPTGAPCSDAHNPLNDARAGGRTAFAQLARENLRVDVKVPQPYDVTMDHLLAAFRNSSASDFYFSALTAPPPLGTCTAYGGSTKSMFTNSSPFGPPGTQLNPGGPLRVEAGSTSVSVPTTSGFEGTFYSLLGAQNPLGFASPPTLLNNGPFTLMGGAFRAALDNATPMNWTNRDQVREMDRTKDLLLTWESAPGPSRGVAIIGVSARVSGNAASGFLCLAPSGATSFTVPAYVLTALPVNESGDFFASTQLSLVNMPLTSGASLPGFDYSFLGVSNWSSKTAVTK
jgi:uncharacterized protein (TIGR03437 family)